MAFKNVQQLFDSANWHVGQYSNISHLSDALEWLDQAVHFCPTDAKQLAHHQN